MNNCLTCNHQITGTPSQCPACGSPLHGSEPLASGSVLKFRYTIEKVLGQGGFGITYQAQDKLFSRKVAIKECFPSGIRRVGQTVVPVGTAAVQEFSQQKEDFLKEAQILAQLQHPSIVQVLDHFEENGTAYSVMELLDGHSIGHLLLANPLETPKVLELAHTVAHALAKVHLQGILHRDIKPDNIMYTTDQRIVLIDFGSARQNTGKTQSMDRLVSIGYSPLEQYSTFAKYGPYTDLYALGATLYHCLQGTPPPAATDLVQGHIVPDLPAHVPSNLQKVILKCLKTTVQDRPQTVQDFLSVLNDEPNYTENNRDFPEHHMHDSTVYQIRFTEDHHIVTASSDYTVKLWDPNALHQHSHSFVHEGEVKSLLCSQNYLISAGDDGMVLIRPWGALSNPYRITYSESVVGLEMIADHLLVATQDRKITLYDLKTRERLIESAPLPHYISQIRVLPEQNKVIIGLNNGHLVFWNTRLQGTHYAGHKSRVCSLLMRNQQILSVGSDGSFLRWDTSGNQLQECYQHDSPVQTALMLNHNTVVFADNNNSLWLLDSTYQARLWLSQREQQVMSMMLSPDHQHIWCGTDQGSVYIIPNPV